jgi:hypothetical protein
MYVKLGTLFSASNLHIPHDSLVSLVTSSAIILKYVICCLEQTFLKESLGGSETVVVAWSQMDEKTEGRTNGRMKTGMQLRQNDVDNHL